ncbi:Protein SPT23 [Yarrowia sp. C11]|nr:Protein SPT23 [Yarrowia sp. E02]KAG5367341.1 Protein SPT23 [Yarrowia sp. C11]
METDAKRGVYSIARSMLPQHFLRRAPQDDYDIEQHLNMNMFEDDDGLNEELDIDMDQFHMEIFSPQQGVVTQTPIPTPIQKSPASAAQSQAQTPTQTAAKAKKRKNENGLGNYKFGRTTPIMYPPSLSPGPSSAAPTYLPDFNPVTWDQMGSHTSHKLVVQDLPPRSRVETQINLSMFVYPPPQQNLVHLPTDTISKPKLQLRQGFEPDADVLMLETVVVCHSEPRNFVNICSGCMNRERKRASRKKVRVPIDEAHWNCDRDRRAIIFNCKEIVELSPVTTEGGVVGRRLDLPMRIACYCRHHGEELGFTAYISLRDHTGRVVAQTKTTPIMITDDHKALAENDVSSLAARVSSESQRSQSQPQSQPQSQNPSPAPEDAAMEIDAVRTTKKRKSGADDTPYSMSSTTSLQKMGSVSETSSIPDTDLFTSVPSSTDFSESYTNMASLMSGAESAAEEDSSLPAVKRLIPSQGSIRGGMEVTLLGQGFHDGLVVKFGDNFASTQCWSDTTIVAQLPATEVAGPVIVSFSDIPVKNPQVFTYIDDTDRQLIELALQVVGLKMNGKLEDAKDIARRLIGGGGVNNVSGVMSQQQQHHDYTQHQMQLESEVIKLLSCCDVMQGSSDNEGLNFTNAKKQSMMHLAAGLGFTRLVVFLTSRGVFLNTQDSAGFTPLHYAALRGQVDVVAYLASQNVNLFVESESGHYALDIAEEEIRSYLMDLMYSGVSASSGDSGSETEVPASSKRARRRRRARGPRGIAQYMYDLNSAVWKSNMGDLYDFIKSPFKVAEPSTTESSSTSSASPTEHGPPKYEDIFPEGSKVPEIDYSSSVIEPGTATTAPTSSWDRKEQTEVSATPTNTPTDEDAGPSGAVEMSEEEVMEAWKSKRTLLHQDIMFFLFWLPIFVALMYWAYLTARSSLMGYSSSSSWDVKSMKDTFLDYTLHVLIPKKHIHKVKWLS